MAIGFHTERLNGVEQRGRPDELPPSGPFGKMDAGLRSELGLAGHFSTLPVGARVSEVTSDRDQLSVIVMGKLVVSLRADGENHRLAVLGPGDTVGDMGFARDRGVSSHADVGATVVGEAARVWTIDRNSFDAFLERDPGEGLEVMRAVARALCRRLRQDSETMLSKALTVQSRFTSE